MAMMGVLSAGGVEVSGVADSTRISKDSLFDTFAAGGPVMWPILLCSLVALAYGVERLIALRNRAVLPAELKNEYDMVMGGLRSGQLKGDQALTRLKTEGSTEGARLFDRFVKRDFVNIRDLEQVLQEYVDVTQWRLQKNIKPLGLVVQVSPLLGLFGTVLGMIQAFDVVAEQGLGKPELLAHGMAVALLTTGFGLGVAIPCSIFHHFLIEKSNLVSLKMYNMLHELALELCGRREDAIK
jgi:biopolymer transport protein ExbB